jgi:putative FmdB family regulatory protein
MPLYEYECDACGGRFEVIQKFSETTTECRRCGQGPVRRLMAAPAFQFKGTGWYVTDYAQKGKPGSEGGTSGSKDSSGAKGDSSKSDSATTDSGKTSESTPATPAATTTKD